ncbi:ATP-dependent helicase HrpA [Nocardioides terrae]|uniref:ATP-dependent helicase HrpA n=1 Tax=Nocardioides terrae TaxID=574651 RepID=A0A1I1I6S6_9ACTN|nr:ATP-dependent RNA helicase HrpA [Nocardioides terrae]SFC28910.1 ATP-dependent helicase HrpA [Nocardioides terrae]
MSELPVAITYPEQLPVTQRRDDIAAAIRDHQVVIVAGETGSGKTTQLPKICLELGRRMIGHTQPRRIAARSVAERIAEELGTELGDLVGYQVRFTDRTSRASRVKVMTDGILLAELQRDRELRRYDTIIIDEAHERSLNIDFLLGYLRQLLPRRPDLKLIITSATIDPERFAEHFGLDSGGRVASASDLGGRVASASDLGGRVASASERIETRIETPAPIIEVSGRTYPVEVRYRPLMELPESDDEGEPVVRDQTEAIVDAVKELSVEGPGDILVFLPGEREIRDTADALTSALGVDRRPGLVEIVPLYSRLSAAEQHRVFSGHTGRRIVLATNVAETSLTVPGIRYVVDTGVARISRYSARTKVQRLPIEPISQASANQRSGRCGRVEAGIAIRLYSEEDFDARPEFTDPEILRTNLASVILQMASLQLGGIEGFPFVEPPDRRNITAGVQLLEELGALRTSSGARAGSGSRGDSAGTAAPADPRGLRPGTPWDGREQAGRRGAAPAPRDTDATRGPRLTRIGERLARLPVDPRLARMVLEAERLGVVREVIVIAAALSLQDPRERPGPDRPQEQAQADQLHARFKHESSDFLTWLNLWRYLKEQQRELSSSAFRRMCLREHLHYLRVREWQEFESQLRQVCKEIGIRAEQLADSPDEDGIHQALLSGLLSQIGLLEERDKASTGDRRGKRPGPREYLGARGARFAIFPGSVLSRKNPGFVMAGELVETGRLWARQVAVVKPEWAERLAGDLVKRSYSEPHWSRKRAAVLAHEKVTLYGVPLVADRLVSYGRVDRAVARELFIRHALVQREWHSSHRFLRENAELLDEARELEHKARRRDIVVDEHTLFDFYDARVGDNVVSGAHFDRWWKDKRREDPRFLTFDPSMVARDVDVSEFPEEWLAGDVTSPLTFKVSYHFEPGAVEDGLTIDIPVGTLNRVEGADFSWNVPGLREELVTALIRSLPKNLRVHFVPAPDRAREFLATVPPGEEHLLDALERWGRSTAGVLIPRGAWDWTKVPEHLRPTYRVVDERGREQARGKDLEALKAPLAGEFEKAIAEVAGDAGLTATGQRTWAFGTIRRTVTEKRAGHEVTVHPCLVDEGASVGLSVVGTEEEAEARHRLGVVRLLLLGLDGLEHRGTARRIVDSLSTADKLGLVAAPYPSAADVVEDCRVAVVSAVVDARAQVRTEQEYDALLAALGSAREHEAAVRAVLADALRALAAHREADKALSGRVDIYQLPAVTDMRAQLARLVEPGFIGRAGPTWLRRYPTYLQAIGVRRRKLDDNLRADADLMARITDLQELYLHQVAALPAGRPPGDRLREVRWLLEEYRVSLWAQQLGTAMPVSDARIRKLLA